MMARGFPQREKLKASQEGGLKKKEEHKILKHACVFTCNGLPPDPKNVCVFQSRVLSAFITSPSRTVRKCPSFSNTMMHSASNLLNLKYLNVERSYTPTSDKTQVWSCFLRVFLYGPNKRPRFFLTSWTMGTFTCMMCTWAILAVRQTN